MGKAVAILVFLLLFFSLSLQIPFIQTQLVAFTSSKLSALMGFDISIARIYINWIDKGVLKGIKIADRQGKSMIEIEKLKIDFDLASLLNRNTNIDKVIAENGAVHLIVDAQNGHLNITEFIDKINELLYGNDTTQSPNPAKFSIDRITLKDLHFTYSDETEAPITDRWDYTHFGFKHIHADISNFWNRRDTIALHIDRGRALEQQYGLPLHNLICQFRYTKHNMSFHALKARVGETILQDTLIFSYRNTDDFSQFNQKVHLYAHLDSTVLHTDDLSIFAPELAEYGQKYLIKGIFKGTVDNFIINKLQIQTRAGSIVRGSLSMKGLPNVQQTFMDIHVKQSRVHPADVGVFGGKDVKAFLDPLGLFDFKGNFTGFVQNFSTRYTLYSQIGDLTGHAQLILPDDEHPPAYKAYFLSQGFDIGKLLNNNDLGVFSFEGKVVGKGFDPKQLHLDLNATFGTAELYGLKLRKLRTVLRFEQSTIKGLLASRDPGLDLDGFVELDYGKNQHLAFIGSILKSTPAQLGLDKAFTAFKVDCNLDLYGFDINHMHGQAAFKNMELTYGGRALSVDNIEIFAQPNSEKRLELLEVRSSMIEAQVKGNFETGVLMDELTQVVQNYVDILTQREQKQKYTAYKPIQADYVINLKNINPLLQLFDVDVQVSQGTTLQGEVKIDEYALFVMDVATPYLAIGNYVFKDNILDLVASKGAKSDDIIASLYIYSKEQQLDKMLQTKNLKIDIGWTAEKLTFTSLAEEKQDNIKLKVVGDAFFGADRIDVFFKPGYFNVVGKNWLLNPQNHITLLRNNIISLEKINLTHDDEYLSITGKVGQGTEDMLEITVQNFQLSTLNPLLSNSVSGKAMADLRISGISGAETRIEGTLETTDVTVDNILLGDFKGTSKYDMAGKKVILNFDLLRGSNKLLNVGGYYALSEKEPLHIDLTLDGAEFSLLEPILKDNASEFKGHVFGNLLVKGTTDKPELYGSVVVKNGGFKINYLNVFYTFNERIYIYPDRIEVRNATLYDKNGGRGLLEYATLSHKYFSNFYVDMRGKLDNFMVLNTSLKDNNLYYGTGIFTGDMTMKGTFDDLFIAANATTRKGTKLYIPLDQAEEVEVKSSYITFYSPVQVDQSKDSIMTPVNSAIKMDFNLDITDDAYGEIIFDSKTGDVLKVNGSGKIKLVIDTRGDFNIIGQYNITKGAYHFTSFNLVNKDFDIKPGSTITWNGGVLEGLLDINTQYQLNASLAPLMQGQIPPDAERELSRRYPVVVKMRLTGNLLSPTITLGIDITDYPRTGYLNSFIPGFLAQLEADEQYRNQQVFSLLMFRMFTGSTLSQNAALGTGNTLSEMLSNQLSNWLSQVNENLEVSLDLGGLDQSSVNSFQLKFSYTLLEGRLRVTRDGTFTNAQNQATASSVAGDWTIEYMLSKDGMYRVKMFHRANQNLDITGLNNNNTIQGASLMHTQSFDSFGELFRNRAKKRKTKQAERKPAPAALKDENEWIPASSGMR